MAHRAPAAALLLCRIPVLYQELLRRHHEAPSVPNARIPERLIKKRRARAAAVGRSNDLPEARGAQRAHPGGDIERQPFVDRFRIVVELAAVLAECSASGADEAVDSIVATELSCGSNSATTVRSRASPIHAAGRTMPRLHRQRAGRWRLNITPCLVATGPCIPRAGLSDWP